MGKPECKHFFPERCTHLHWISSIRASLHYVYWAMSAKKECRTRNRLTSDDTNHVGCWGGSVHLQHLGDVAGLGIPDSSLYVDCFLWSNFQHDVPSLRQLRQLMFLGGHRSYLLRVAHFATRRNLVIFSNLKNSIN